ncbi:MAG: hypothetical protein ACK59B_11325, partial [Alphaproteobacteria bacterium]
MSPLWNCEKGWSCQPGNVMSSPLAAAPAFTVSSNGPSPTKRIGGQRPAGARIVDQPWLGWGFQKRKGEDACSHDWVLDLDADEVVTPE